MVLKEMQDLLDASAKGFADDRASVIPITEAS